MVKKRMAMRMLTIFVALIVCGMFFPGLARGATGDSVSSDTGYKNEEGYILVEFKDLQLNEKSEIPVKLTNESDKSLKLRLLLESDVDCKFEYLGPPLADLGPKGSETESLTVNFTYEPSNYEECGAKLPIIDHVTNETLATIKLIGVLEEPGEEPTEDPSPLGKIFIGGVPTGVDDRMADAENSVGDMIQECVDTAHNHGYLVRCVGLLARELWRDEIISCQDRRDLSGAAVTAEMLIMMREIKTAKRCGTRGDNSRHWRWHHWPQLRHR